MFKISRVNVIESDEGFSVEFLGPAGILYVEGEKSIHISSEILGPTSPDLLVLYTRSIKAWDPPNDNEAINHIKQNEIVENIHRAFRFRGSEIRIR